MGVETGLCSDFRVRRDAVYPDPGRHPGSSPRFSFLDNVVKSPQYLRVLLGADPPGSSSLLPSCCGSHERREKFQAHAGQRKQIDLAGEVRLHIAPHRKRPGVKRRLAIPPCALLGETPTESCPGPMANIVIPKFTFQPLKDCLMTVHLGHVHDSLQF